MVFVAAYPSMKTDKYTAFTQLRRIVILQQGGVCPSRAIRLGKDEYGLKIFDLVLYREGVVALAGAAFVSSIDAIPRC